jgi:uncharacterized protein with HEPN domain
MRDSRERLHDILQAIANLARYPAPDKAAFESDELLQSWFLRQLQIIGEAARAVPDEVRAMAPAVPWPKVVGMRNVLVHGYFDIDTDLVWETATHDAPALKPAIEALLRSLQT